jgi:hypothetical protein
MGKRYRAYVFQNCSIPVFFERGLRETNFVNKKYALSVTLNQNAIGAFKSAALKTLNELLNLLAP